MEMLVGTLPAKFYILKKCYKAYNGCIFFQIRFRLFHDTLEYIYVFSGLFQEDRQELYIKPEKIPEDMETSTAVSFMQYTVGLINVFNLLKEEIYELVEDVLDKQEFGHLRFTFLPI